MNIDLYKKIVLYFNDEDLNNDIFHKYDKKVKLEHYKKTHLFLRHSFNKKLKEKKLCIKYKDLKYLKCGYYFNQEIQQNDLPNKLKYLEFGNNFNQKICFEILPITLEKIVFGKHFNRRIKNIDTLIHLKYLQFGDNFNTSLKNKSFPNSLTHLVFGHNFNQPIDTLLLPNNLTHLVFGHNFNQPIDTLLLPNNLTHLVFGNSFNQFIDKIHFPNSITHLIFGEDFNQCIDTVLFPNSLTHITFGSLFKQLTESIQFPNSLIHLSFDYFFFKSYNKIKILKKYQNIKHLKYLTCNFHKKVNIENDVFSENIESLVLDIEIIFLNNFVDILPKKIKYLRFRDDFDNEKKNTFTQIINLKHLHNLIEIILPEKFDLNLLEINNNVLIGIYIVKSYLIVPYKKYDIYDTHYSIKYKNIKKKLTIDSLNIIKDEFLKKFENIIFKELVEKVFHPKKINNYLSKYNYLEM